MYQRLSAIAALLMASVLISGISTAEMVHPVCMEQLQDGPEQPSGSKEVKTLDINQCQKKYQALPFEQLSEFHARFFPPESKQNINLPQVVDYKIIGSLDKQQTLVSIATNYGGTMTLSNGLIISETGKGEQRTLTRHYEIPGGDRCFGGIEKMVITAPDTIEIERRVTTADLLTLNRENAPVVEEVSGCAICCIGMIKERMVLGQTPELQEIRLDQQQPQTDYAHRQACFNQLTGEVSEQRPLVLNPKQLQELQQNFDRNCSIKK